MRPTRMRRHQAVTDPVRQRDGLGARGPSCGQWVLGGDRRVLLFPGIADADEPGHTARHGDFRSQAERVLSDLARLMATEGIEWGDVTRTTVFLRDLDRDLPVFREVWTEFHRERSPLGHLAMTYVEGIFEHDGLAVEIAALALLPAARPKP